MEVRYWAKFSYKDGTTVATGEDHHFAPKSQLAMKLGCPRKKRPTKLFFTAS